MSAFPYLFRTAALLLAPLALTIACSGDGGPSGPGTSVSLHTLDASAVTEANSFSVRLRGARPDSVTGVRIGGADVIAGLLDSTLHAVMPIGPAGSVTLEATAWVGSRSVPASVTLTRAAGPTIGDPVAATTALLSELDDDIMEGIFLPPGDGVDPDLLAAERDDIAALRDSLAAQLARLDPTARSIALSIIRQMRDETSAALLASSESTACKRSGEHDERLACVAAAKQELRRKLIRAAKWGLLVGASAWALIPAGALAASTAGVAAVAAGIVAAVMSYGALEAKTALSDWVNSSYEHSVESVVRIRAELEEAIDEPFELRQATDAFSASVTEPFTMQPGIPRRLPIQRVTRSAIVGDTFPAVRGVADSVNLLAQHWNEFSAKLPRPLRLSAPTIGTTPARTMTEPADFGEVSVVSVREGATTPPVTASLSDASPGINLTLSGDPGAGRDLTVRLALDGAGAGRVEIDVPVRYQAAPDSVAWAIGVLNGVWTGYQGNPVNQEYCAAAGGYFFPPNFSNADEWFEYGTTWAMATWSYSCEDSSWRTRTWRFYLRWAPETGWTGYRRTDAGGLVGIDVLEFTASTLRISQMVGDTPYIEVFTRGGG